MTCFHANKAQDTLERSPHYLLVPLASEATPHDCGLHPSHSCLGLRDDCQSVNDNRHEDEFISNNSSDCARNELFCQHNRSVRKHSNKAVEIEEQLAANKRSINNIVTRRKQHPHVTTINNNQNKNRQRQRRTNDSRSHHNAGPTQSTRLMNVISPLSRVRLMQVPRPHTVSSLRCGATVRPCHTTGAPSRVSLLPPWQENSHPSAPTSGSPVELATPTRRATSSASGNAALASGSPRLSERSTASAHHSSHELASATSATAMCKRAMVHS